MTKLPDKIEKSHRDFYESVASLYPEEELVYSSLRGILRRQFILSRLKLVNGTFLDLGCNRGYYLSKYLRDKALGIDISLVVLKIAKTRNPKASFIQGDAQNLSFLRSNSINAILCSELIEHVPNAQKVIAECFRILKPNGDLFVTTPNYKKKRPAWVNIGEMKKYGVEGMRGNDYFHTAYRTEELKLMAEKVGFRIIELGTFEKEVKYSTRIPVVFYYIISFLNKYFFISENLEQINEKWLNRGSLLIYNVVNFLGLNNFFVSLVKEGVRTYLIAKKPE